MEYTQNYQLPLWDKEDAIKRTDFNENNQKIDAAIASTASISGNYTSLSSEQVNVTLGFRPKIVVIAGSGQDGGGLAVLLDGYGANVFYHSSTGRSYLFGLPCGFTDDGFYIAANASCFNDATGYTFRYVAFR